MHYGVASRSLLTIAAICDWKVSRRERELATCVLSTYLSSYLPRYLGSYGHETAVSVASPDALFEEGREGVRDASSQLVRKRWPGTRFYSIWCRKSWGRIPGNVRSNERVGSNPICGAQLPFTALARASKPF